MLATEKRAQAAGRLRALYRKAVDEHVYAIEKETEFVAAHLQPGQGMPKVKALTGSRREAFKENVGKWQAEAMSTLDELRELAAAEVTAAPSEEAIRALQAFKMRENVSDAEKAAFLGAYGDNYQIRKAVGDGGHDEYAEALSAIEELQSDVMHVLDANGLADGTVTRGQVGFASAFIPSTLGVSDDAAGSME